VFDAQQRRWLVPLSLCLLVLVFDQLSKLWILNTLEFAQGFSVVGDWFNIIYSRNTGVAFGLFQNMSPLFTIVSLLISAGAIYVYTIYLPNHTWSVQISLGLILGGAFGNIIDRIRLGYVVDFIQVGWWPVFNVADSAITVGATVLAFFLLFTPEDEPQPGPYAPGDDALLNELLHRDVSQEHGAQEHDQRHPPQ
jgi:signal peptidase II